jgi:glutathione S-transferase
LAKKIKVEMVLVDLIKGEQRNPEFLAINPQGKVPAIRCHNCPNIPDCILYESQAIVEWLDEQFPDSFPSLYPSPRQFLDRLHKLQAEYDTLSASNDKLKTLQAIRAREEEKFEGPLYFFGGLFVVSCAALLATILIKR